MPQTTPHHRRDSAVDGQGDFDEVVVDAINDVLFPSVAVIAGNDVDLMATAMKPHRRIANPPLDRAATGGWHGQQLGADMTDPHAAARALAAPSSASTRPATRSAERPSVNWH